MRIGSFETTANAKKYAMIIGPPLAMACCTAAVVGRLMRSPRWFATGLVAGGLFTAAYRSKLDPSRYRFFRVTRRILSRKEKPRETDDSGRDKSMDGARAQESPKPGESWEDVCSPSDGPYSRIGFQPSTQEPPQKRRKAGLKNRIEQLPEELQVVLGLTAMSSVEGFKPVVKQLKDDAPMLISGFSLLLCATVGLMGFVIGNYAIPRIVATGSGLAAGASLGGAFFILPRLTLQRVSPDDQPTRWCD